MVGNTPIEERQRIFKDFEDGIVQIICSVDVLVEGFDADVRCVIYAKPTKSEMRWCQSIGRAVRTAKGKVVAKIFDHSGTVIRLGYPHHIEYDNLFSEGDAHKKAQQARIKEKTESKEKECPSCNYIKPPGEYVCTKCGFKPIFGQNGEVDESIELASMQQKEQYTMEDKKRWHSELSGYWQLKVNEGKNWKQGWISHKYKEKFGVWPNKLRFNPVEPSAEVVNYIKHLNIKGAKTRASKDTAARGIKMLREMMND
jgi:superfamily II DNA or RNA helicase